MPKFHHLTTEMSIRTKHEHPEPIGGGTPPAEMAAPGASGNRAAAQQPTARQLRQNDDRQVLTCFPPKNATERLLCSFSPKNRQKRPENQIRRRPARSRAKPKPSPSRSRAKPKPSRESASNAKSPPQSPARAKAKPSRNQAENPQATPSPRHNLRRKPSPSRSRAKPKPPRLATLGQHSPTVGVRGRRAGASLPGPLPAPVRLSVPKHANGTPTGVIYLRSIERKTPGGCLCTFNGARRAGAL